MPAATVRDLEGLPAVLNLRHVQEVLGISRPKVYELAHSQGFPTVRIGRSIRVPRQLFLRWLEGQTGLGEERA